MLPSRIAMRSAASISILPPKTVLFGPIIALRFSFAKGKVNHSEAVRRATPI
jgi:hypothetical protein